MEAEWPIYLQIVVDERQLSVTHTPTIMNPVSGEEVKLVVVRYDLYCAQRDRDTDLLRFTQRSTSLNLEHLFQQTLQYHSYSLLFALQEALFADTKLGLFSDDVRLINANQGEFALPTCNLQSVCTFLLLRCSSLTWHAVVNLKGNKPTSKSASSIHTTCSFRSIFGRGDSC